MEFNIKAKGHLIDGPLQIALKDVPIGVDVIILVSTLDADGRVWESWAKFQADPSGMVDTNKQASLDGTYTGVDATGLIWSMYPKIATAWQTKFTAGEFVSLTLKFKALINRVVVASTNIERIIKTPDVRCDFVKHGDMYGWFYRPDHIDFDKSPKQAEFRKRPGFPAILLVPGIGGYRALQPIAALLASHGYAVLLLVYSGYAELLNEPYLVPLELIAQAVDWLTQQPIINAERIMAIGNSHGSEMLLAAVAYMPEIKLQSLILHDPSHVIWQGQGVGRCHKQLSSWSFQSKGLPFVPIRANKLRWQQVTHKLITSLGWSKFFTKYHGIRLIDIYQKALNDNIAVEKALIPLTHLHVPILLISGEADAVIPSATMGDYILEKLKANNTFPCEHLSYAGFGHGINLPGIPTTGMKIDYNNMPIACGGTPQATAEASRTIWIRILDFLSQ